MFEAIEKLVSLLHRGVLMNYRSYGLNHSNRVIILPYIPPHIDASRSDLHSIFDKLKNVQLCLQLRSSSDNKRNRAALKRLPIIKVKKAIHNSGPSTKE